MRAVITGGAGFIGSHLAEALLSRGHQVTVVDDLSTGTLNNISPLLRRADFEWVLGSVNNEALMKRLMKGADVVFHLAAAVGVRLVVDAPIHTIETNVNGTEVILRCAKANRTRVIVASTSEVYGKSTALPFREDADLVLGPPDKPRWGYAASKLIDEFLAMAYYKEHQVPTTVVRFFNCVGPRQSSRYGMVLPNFVQRALAGEPLIVHGDGRQTRSFTWIGDVVSALLTIAEHPRTVGQVFNIGNDHEVSIAELAKMVQHAVGTRVALEFIAHTAVFGADFEDMQRRVPDISKIQRTIGWRPEVALKEIVARTVAYWEKEARTASEPARSTARVAITGSLALG